MAVMELVRNRVHLPDLGGYCGMLASRETEDSAAIVAAWTTKVGALDEVVLLYDPAIGTAAHHAPVRERRSMRLTVERPFAPLPDWANFYELRTYYPRDEEVATFVGMIVGSMPMRERYNPNAGIWSAPAGAPDRVLHLWPYATLDQWLADRARLDQDEEWRDYSPRALSLLTRGESTLLTPLLLPRR